MPASHVPPQPPISPTIASTVGLMLTFFATRPVPTPPTAPPTSCIMSPTQSISQFSLPYGEVHPPHCRIESSPVRHAAKSPSGLCPPASRPPFRRAPESPILLAP